MKKSTKSSSSTLFHHYPTGSYSTTPTMKPLQHTYSTTSGMPHLVRPSGFSPYYIPPPPPPSSQAPSHHMVRIDIFTLPKKSFKTNVLFLMVFLLLFYVDFMLKLLEKTTVNNLLSIFSYLQIQQNASGFITIFVP